MFAAFRSRPTTHSQRFADNSENEKVRKLASEEVESEQLGKWETKKLASEEVKSKQMRKWETKKWASEHVRKWKTEKVRNTKSEKSADTDFRTARTQDRIHILPSLQTTQRAVSGPRSGCKEGNFPIAEFWGKKKENAKTDKINNVVGSGPTRTSAPIDEELRSVTETLSPPDDR